MTLLTILLFISLGTIIGLYLRVVLERVHSIYFYHMMVNGRVASNHQKKLSELSLAAAQYDTVDDAKLAQFDVKASLAWEVATVDYTKNLEYKIWRPITDVHTEEQKKQMAWEWD